MKQILLTELPQNPLNAGSKAKRDIRQILIAEGYLPLDVHECFSLGKLPRFFKLCRELRALPDGSALTIQWPVYSFYSRKFMPALLRLLQKKAFLVTLIVHDLESARFEKNSEKALLEQQLLSRCARIVLHNEAMRDFLGQSLSLPPQRLAVLGIFDYLCPDPKRSAQPGNTVAVAGNLSREKAGYLYRLSELDGIAPLRLYGANYSGEDSAQVHYCGAFAPEELPARLDAAYGLVWDGDSCDTCAGVTGQYLRINDPHKASLYLAAGLPVLIWSEAALAPFLVKNGLGLTVDCLQELQTRLSSVSPEEYRRLAENAARFGARLRAGEMIRSVLRQSAALDEKA